MGVSDKEMAKKLGVTEATVRRQRFTRPLEEPAEYYAFDFGADGMCLENTALRYFIFLPYSLGRNVGLEK